MKPNQTNTQTETFHFLPASHSDTHARTHCTMKDSVCPFQMGVPTLRATCGPGWLWMGPNTKPQIYLKPFFCSSAFVIVCVFNVWPKTILVPVWPRDAKRLDTPGSRQYNMARKSKKDPQIRKEEVNRGQHNCLCRESVKSTKKLLELISEFNKVAG